MLAYNDAFLLISAIAGLALAGVLIHVLVMRLRTPRIEAAAITA